MIKAICEAFCNKLTIKEIRSGFAVGTPFLSIDGDPISFYILKSPERADYFKLEDAGVQIPFLEASGVDLTTGTRGDAFASLLSEYKLQYDSEARSLRTAYLATAELPRAALQFMAALLRLQDFALLAAHMVRNTFKEDAIAAIEGQFSGKAEVEIEASVSELLGGFEADVVVRAPPASPLAVYLGTSDERVLQALVLRMETAKYRAIPCRVVLIIEKATGHGIREPSLALALARLDYVGSFRGVERETMERLELELNVGTA